MNCPVCNVEWEEMTDCGTKNLNCLFCGSQWILKDKTGKTRFHWFNLKFWRHRNPRQDKHWRYEKDGLTKYEVKI